MVENAEREREKENEREREPGLFFEGKGKKGRRKDVLTHDRVL